MSKEFIILEQKLGIMIIIISIVLIFKYIFSLFKTINTNIFRIIIVGILYKFSNIFKIFPQKKNNIIFINGHSDLFNGNIKALYDEIDNNYSNYNLIIYTKNDMSNKYSKSIKKIFKKIEKLYYILTANIIIVNDYISLFSKIKVRNSTQFVQVWHAGGAFKKFGKDSLQNIQNENNMKNCIACHSQYDKAIVSSEEVVDIYANAFEINKQKVLPLGLARADKFYNKAKIEEVKNNFIKKHCNLKNKKVLLYAPTFRDGERKNFNLKLDLEYLHNSLPDEYMIITKMHPFIKNGVNVPFNLSDRIMDLSSEDIDDLMIISDILITDYSSMIFEYAIMEKPMIFFAYDLPLYNNSLRGFYYNYEAFVPGPIVSSTIELVEVIKKDQWDMEKIKKFKKKFNGYNDGNATKRIVENILNNN